MKDDGQETLDKGSELSRSEVFIYELVTSSDRATALLAHSYLERLLRRSIAFALKGRDQDSLHLLGNDDVPGVLGFADQCRLAHCLGLVTADMVADLLLIAKVRNRFGHNPYVVSFSDQRISHRCNELKTQKPPKVLVVLTEKEGAPPAREKYLKCVFAIFWHLMENIADTAERFLEELRKRKGIIPTAPDQQDAPPKSPK